MVVKKRAIELQLDNLLLIAPHPNLYPRLKLDLQLNLKWAMKLRLEDLIMIQRSKRPTVGTGIGATDTLNGSGAGSESVTGHYFSLYLGLYLH